MTNEIVKSVVDVCIASIELIIALNKAKVVLIKNINRGLSGSIILSKDNSTKIGDYGTCVYYKGDRRDTFRTFNTVKGTIILFDERQKRIKNRITLK